MQKWIINDNYQAINLDHIESIEIDDGTDSVVAYPEGTRVGWGDYWICSNRQIDVDGALYMNYMSQNKIFISSVDDPYKLYDAIIAFLISNYEVFSVKAWREHHAQED